MKHGTSNASVGELPSKKARNSSYNKLLESCATGDLDAIQLGISCGTISIEDVISNDFECVKVVLTNGHQEVFNALNRLLLLRDEPQNSESLAECFINSPLFQPEKVMIYLPHFAEKGWFNCIKQLHENPIVMQHLITENMDGVLCDAAISGHWQVIELILNKAHEGQNRFCIDLFEAAAKGGHLHIIEQLLNRPEFNLNTLDTVGERMLNAAARNGKVNVVQFLLSNEIPYYPLGETIVAILVLALANSHTSLVTNLLSRPNVLKLIADKSWFPLIMPSLRGAITSGNLELLDYILAIPPQTIPFLTHSFYVGLFHGAALIGSLAIIKRLHPLLIQWGYHNGGSETLYKAVTGNRKAVVNYLKDYAVPDDSFSILNAMGFAAKRGYLAVVNLLLEIDFIRAQLDDCPANIVDTILQEASRAEDYSPSENTDALSKIAAHYPALRESIELRKSNIQALMGVYTLARSCQLPLNILVQIGELTAGPEPVFLFAYSRRGASFQRMIELGRPTVALMEQQPIQGPADPSSNNEVEVTKSKRRRLNK